MWLRERFVRLGNFGGQWNRLGPIPHQRCTVQRTTTLRSYPTQSTGRFSCSCEERERERSLLGSHHPSSVRSRVITYNYESTPPLHEGPLQVSRTISRQRLKQAVQCASGCTSKEATTASYKWVIGMRLAIISPLWARTPISPVKPMLLLVRGDTCNFHSMLSSHNQQK